MSRVTLTNVNPGMGGVKIKADVEITLAADLVLVIRDVRLVYAKKGMFVGMPSRQRGSGWVDAVELTGEQGKQLTAEIREALKAEFERLNNTQDAEADDDDCPF